MSKDLHFKMREEEVTHLLNEVEQGNERALPIYAELKKHKDLYDQATKQIESFAMDEANDYADKTFSDSGFTFEKRNGGTRFSFKHIPEWERLENEKKAIEEKSKQAYFAQQKGILTASEEGEEIILPKISYSKDSLIVKKK